MLSNSLSVNGSLKIDKHCIFNNWDSTPRRILLEGEETLMMMMIVKSSRNSANTIMPMMMIGVIIVQNSKQFESYLSNIRGK